MILCEIQADWSAAYAAWAAVAVSVFLQAVPYFYYRFTTWRRRPRITLSFPPDYQMNQDLGQGAPYFWSRLLIQNDGKTTAAGVSVFMNSMECTNGDHLGQPQHFLPICLCWTHKPSEENQQNIGPGVGRFCDFLSLQTLGMTTRRFCLVQHEAAEVLNTVLTPGTWVAKIVVTGENFEPINKTVQIEWDGNWNVNNQTIRDTHLRVSIN